MKKKIINGIVFVGNKFQHTDILMEDEIILEIGTTISLLENQIYDAKGNYIVPGFIDLHTHGGTGIDVNAATASDYEKLSHFFAKQGTTSWLCSILTDTKEQTSWCIEQFHAFQKQHTNCANLLGIHLEGPFLAKDYKGAMPEHLLIPANLELMKQYQTLANGMIRYITVSPEVAGIPDIIPSLIKLGITVAIGHSGADYNTAMDCINQGAISATHTFNAMKLIHQHVPAISTAVLESDIYCEAICDGRHLHPAIVRLLLKVKGLHRIIAITDSIMATGLPDGNYKLGINDIIVTNGDAQLANGSSRAGSTLTTNQALINLVKFTQRPLEELLPLLTENPAKLIGEFDHIGSIDIGKQADLVVLDKNLNVRDTFVRGVCISNK